MSGLAVELVAAVLARLSKAHAECAKELNALSYSHATLPAQRGPLRELRQRRCSATILLLALMPRMCCVPSRRLMTQRNEDRIREAGAIPPLVALLSGGPESLAAENASKPLANLGCGGDEAITL